MSVSRGYGYSRGRVSSLARQVGQQQQQARRRPGPMQRRGGVGGGGVTGGRRGSSGVRMMTSSDEDDAEEEARAEVCTSFKHDDICSVVPVMCLACTVCGVRCGFLVPVCVCAYTCLCLCVCDDVLRTKYIEEIERDGMTSRRWYPRERVGVIA